MFRHFRNTHRSACKRLQKSGAIWAMDERDLDVRTVARMTSVRPWFEHMLISRIWIWLSVFTPVKG